MSRKNTNNLLILLLTLCLLGAFFTLPTPAQAQAGTPGEMHDQINQLRAANGLYALSVNSYLMQSAQNHANWIAAGNPGGHTGEGGSTAYDRALAVGYGEGAEVYVTENWARGYGLTVSDCIYVMWDDDAHMGNMLTTWHNEFGAGVALDGDGMTIYVVNFGHVSGNVPVQPTVESTGDPDGETITPSVPTNTLEPFIQPVTTSTPGSDGSVTHIVQYGQSLWGIADAYDVPFTDLLAQNNLTEDSPIYPDQELLIFPATIEIRETPEVTETLELTQEPTRTQSPTETLPSTPTTPAATPTATPKDSSGFLANIFSGETLWLGIGLVAVSVFGVALLLFTSSRLK